MEFNPYNPPTSNVALTLEVSRKEWWRSKRLQYNIMLAIAGVISFIFLGLLSEVLPASSDDNDMFTIFGMILNGMVYLICMLIANLFYNLGSLIEWLMKPENPNKLRSVLFYGGTTLSMTIPLLLPISWLIRGSW